MELDSQNRTYHEAQSSMELLPNYYTWTYGKFLNAIQGEVLELGCGAGLGIDTYIDAASVVYAVDHNPQLLERVSERFSGRDVKTVAADLMGDWSELDGVQSDVAIMMDVVEHFRDDEDFLRNAARFVKPGGKLIVKVPAQASLYSEMDRSSGHYRRYEKSDIRRIADAAGLKILRVKSINTLGGLAYRFKNKSSSNFSKTFSPGQLRLINTAMRVLSLGDYIPGLTGLSFIALLEKPRAQ